VKLQEIDLKLYHVENCLIRSTSLGYGDRGLMSCWVHLDKEVGSQGAGGYRLDNYDKELGTDIPHAVCGWFVGNILKTVGVDNWEDLKGKHVRALHLSDDWNESIIGLCNITKNKGFLFKNCNLPISEGGAG